MSSAQSPEPPYDNRPIAVILVDENDYERAFVVVGIVRATPEGFVLRAGDQDAVELRGREREFEAFPLHPLDELFTPPAVAELGPHVAGIELATVLWTRRPPPSAIVLTSPFWGFATGASGEILLMRNVRREPRSDLMSF